MHRKATYFQIVHRQPKGLETTCLCSFFRNLSTPIKAARNFSAFLVKNDPRAPAKNNSTFLQNPMSVFRKYTTTTSPNSQVMPLELHHDWNIYFFSNPSRNFTCFFYTFVILFHEFCSKCSQNSFEFRAKVQLVVRLDFLDVLKQSIS